MSLQVFLSLASKGLELKSALEEAFYAKNKTELPINTSLQGTQTSAGLRFKLEVSVAQVQKKAPWEFDKLISVPPPELMQIIRILKGNLEELKPALEFYKEKRFSAESLQAIEKLAEHLQTIGLDKANAALCSECIDLTAKAGSLSKEAFDKFEPEDKIAFAEVQKALGNGLWNLRLKMQKS